MDKCRPIEAGCRAIETEDWTILTVISYCEETSISEGESCWVVEPDNPETFEVHENHAPSDWFWCSESILIRIDDPDLQKEIENEQETVNS